MLLIVVTKLREIKKNNMKQLHMEGLENYVVNITNIEVFIPSKL